MTLLGHELLSMPHKTSMTKNICPIILPSMQEYGSSGGQQQCSVTHLLQPRGVVVSQQVIMH